MKIELPACPIGGQMTDFERKKLFTWVYESEPSTVVEIGGGEGGGSTFYMIEAMAQLKDSGKSEESVFLSADPLNGPAQMFFGTNDRYKYFTKFFPLSDHIKYVFTHPEAPSPDFIFFDGPDDENFNLQEFLHFDNIAKSGCKFVCHDWETQRRALDGHVCPKVNLLRPYLEQLDTWETIECLSGVDNVWPNELETKSVGLIYMQKK